EMYLKALGTDRLTGEQVAEALVDLKRRINGDFYVIEHDETKIVLGNRMCPFAEKVVGRESMCMMTS
ncbi:methanogen output domain 1-containing protein, partial [Streptomyces sp. TRM76130]|nr:methanogen output domain 1-containing protein [Streptomyces sp. TRM76130]